MNEIKESDIQVRSHDGYAGVWIQTSSPTNTKGNTVKAYEIKQQILQNQKDTQEYKTKAEWYDVVRQDFGKYIDLGTNKLDEALQLQSQHKKLVDAIQKSRIVDLKILRHRGLTEGGQKVIEIGFQVPEDSKSQFDIITPFQELQNLLKESEK